MTARRDHVESFWRVFLRVPAWAWVAAALAARLAYVLLLGSRNYQIDEVGFSAYARYFAETGGIGYGGHPAATAPVPPVFFGLFFKVFGEDLFYPRLGHAFVGAATVWLVGRLAERLSGSARAGRLALALAAVYPFFIYYNGVMLSESLYLLFLVPALTALAGSIDCGDAREAALGGFLLAMAGLTRAEGAYVGALVMLGGVALALARRWPARALAAALACWLLTLSAWSARNKAVLGEWTLDGHGGVSLLHGTVLYDRAEEIDTSEAMRAVEAMPFYQEALKLPPAQQDAAFRRAAVEFMLAHPAETFWQWCRKFVAFWRFYPRQSKAYHQTVHSRPDLGLKRGALTVISLLFEPWLILGGLWGLWRLRRAALLPAALFIAGTAGIHVLVVSMMRYRLPVMPLLIAGVCALLAGDARLQSKKR